MLSALQHRGPDDTGLHEDGSYSLGHVRLSIVDPVSGKQPMSSPDGGRHVVFNGEIYNHQELRQSLGSADFRTNSDTEVLLHLGEAERDPRSWVPQLDGMFAFAVTSGGEITLARDPLGIKPLYIGARDGAMVFASEMKGILEVSEQVAEFPAGHVYSSSTGLKPYYSLDPGEPDIGSVGPARRGVSQRLEDAVRKRLMGDVPVGVFLSGGLDSSIIACLASRHKRPLDTFSVGTEDSLDRGSAHQVADFLGSRHHEYVYTLAEAIESLPEIIYYLESFDSALVRSAIPNFFLCRLASEHVKVALSGEGADEIFAGYSYLKDIQSDDLHGELVSITDALHNTNLQRCDRMSMAHGLEVRVPFLDVDLVEYAFRIGTDLKLRAPDRVEKWVLRKVAEGMLPNEIVWRKKAKFAVGSGLGDMLARFAESQITEAEFVREREIADGVFLDSKEEMFYYRIFREQYPAERLLPLIGRSRSI
jgi:asparagine synthase (glutamine-hydrolysing)